MQTRKELARSGALPHIVPKMLGGPAACKTSGTETYPRPPTPSQTARHQATALASPAPSRAHPATSSTEPRSAAHDTTLRTQVQGNTRTCLRNHTVSSAPAETDAEPAGHRAQTREAPSRPEPATVGGTEPPRSTSAHPLSDSAGLAAPPALESVDNHKGQRRRAHISIMTSRNGWKRTKVSLTWTGWKWTTWALPELHEEPLEANTVCRRKCTLSAPAEARKPRGIGSPPQDAARNQGQHARCAVLPSWMR